MLLQYTFNNEEKIIESIQLDNENNLNEKKKPLEIDEVITSEDEEIFLYGHSDDSIINLVNFFFFLN